MPGFHAPLSGGAAFLVVKVAGYSLYGHYLNWLFGRRRSVILVAIVRAVLGAVSLAVLAVALKELQPGPGMLRTDYAFLILLRLITWCAVVALMYDHVLADRRAVVIAILGGTLLSCALDVPAFFGLLAFGRADLC
ncbi:MAG: hypothetical protein U0136_13615 [Bdellovibrionota bacterium]